jgi:hypothetical protein
MASFRPYSLELMHRRAIENERRAFAQMLAWSAVAACAICVLFICLLA